MDAEKEKISDLIFDAQSTMYARERYAPPPTMHRAVEANTLGRDFIIGDLHGCFDQLQEKLNQVNFDTGRDRLFSVGDLIDRGPDSYKCLKLIEEPWFYTVLGNHESMMLQYLGVRSNAYTQIRDFLKNGGRWFSELDADQQLEVFELAHTKLRDIPLRLTVRHSAGDFDVVHAQFCDRFNLDPFHDDLAHSDEIEYTLVWERSLAYHTLHQVDPEEKDLIQELRDGEEKELISIEPYMMKGRRLTYVGHTVLKMPMLCRSHVFLDTGAYGRYHGSPNTSLTMIEHSTKKLY